MFIALALSSTQKMALVLLPLFMFFSLGIASVLLFTGMHKSLSRRKRLAYAILILAVFPAALSSVAAYVLTSDYLKFVEKDQHYYRDFARACDAIRLKRPAETNEFLFVAATNIQLPKIVEHWNPRRLTFYSNGLDILVGEGHSDFVISWHQTQLPGQTDSWVLETSGEPPARMLYTELRR